jgi:hypothetical protein
MLFVLVGGLLNNQPHPCKPFLLSLAGEKGAPLPGPLLPREGCQQVLPVFVHLTSGIILYC